jgi:hypothetical protein
MHDALGHGGVNQTLACLRQSFHWSGMPADVGMFVRVCDSCQRRKLVMPEPPTLQEPLKAHVVIMVDYFTKAAEFAVVYDKTPASVAKAFYYTWICRYFVPSHVTSDNGTEFETDFVHWLQGHDFVLSAITGVRGAKMSL